MTKHILVVAASALALTACGKATESATEKIIESQMAKDGTKAKVDLSGGGVKMSSTDASGKTTQMEMGNARISEADLGLSFYPGTQPAAGGATRVSSADATMYTVMLHSDDAPDKVAAYYRDKLKGQSEGKQYTETSGNGSHMLMLADDKQQHVTQVMVGKADPKGSDIQIIANRGAAK